MSIPLTDSINALTAYANEVTGASDTTLSDAVHTLASGYGGGELYPVATDIVTKYLSRNLSTGYGLFVHGTINYTTGEFTQTDVETDSGICLTYIPINPSYTYYKSSGGRFYKPCYYDENYEYIGRGTEHNNLSFQQVMDEMPENARYMRFGTHPNTNNWIIQIYRMG